jgi:hypothetical protein
MTKVVVVPVTVVVAPMPVVMAVGQNQLLEGFIAVAERLNM